MTPAMEALARRAVAAGFHLAPEDRPLTDLGRSARDGSLWHASESGWVPVLADAATTGCLLRLVREAWGAMFPASDEENPIRKLWVQPYYVGDAKGWAVIGSVGRGPFRATEAEALVAALEEMQP